MQTKMFSCVFEILTNVNTPLYVIFHLPNWQISHLYQNATKRRRRMKEIQTRTKSILMKMWRADHLHLVEIFAKILYSILLRKVFLFSENYHGNGIWVSPLCFEWASSTCADTNPITLWPSINLQLQNPLCIIRIVLVASAIKNS